MVMLVIRDGIAPIMTSLQWGTWYKVTLYEYDLLYISVLNSTFVAFYCVPCEIEINHTTSMLQGLIYCEMTIVESSGCETSPLCKSRRDEYAFDS